MKQKFPGTEQEYNGITIKSSHGGLFWMGWLLDQAWHIYGWFLCWKHIWFICSQNLNHREWNATFTES
jgi:hypothetical protein